MRRHPITAALLAAAAALGVLGACGPHAGAATSDPIIGQPFQSTTTGVIYSAVDTSGTPASQYRIPALAVTSDAVVACYDSRNNSGADLPSEIDIVCKRSADNGQTWSARNTAVSHTGGNTDSTANGVGDGSLIYDPATGRLWLSYLSAPAGVGFGNSSTDTSATSTTTVHPQIRYSTDDGQTWSAPTDLTALKPPGAGGIFATSGHGTILADGTLVQPYSYLVAGTAYAALAYSTDHGSTWHMGTTVGSNIGENKAVQLADGTLLDDARSSSQDYRMWAAAPTVTGTWSVPAADDGMPDPQCNGDVIRVDATTGQADSSWLLASNADSQTTRANGVVRLSEDNGQTWPYSWSATSSPYWAFGYSVMTRLADGSFGVLYEHQASDNGGSLEFAHFTMAVFP